MQIIHEKSALVLGRNVAVANSFWLRLRGYMFYQNPPSLFDGLYFPRCNLVHNSFVRFPIDVVFVDKNFLVVKVLRDFRPWRWSRIYFRAAHAIEFPAGTVSEKVNTGDKLIVES